MLFDILVLKMGLRGKYNEPNKPNLYRMDGVEHGKIIFPEAENNICDAVLAAEF